MNKRAVMTVPVMELAQMLDTDLTDNDIQEWTEAHSNDPGHQLYIDEEIFLKSRDHRNCAQKKRLKERRKGHFSVSLVVRQQTCLNNALCGTKISLKQQQRH